MAKTTTTPKDDAREAYRLAITMLSELESSTDLCEACALDEMLPERTQPQDNIVLRYLETCRALSPAAEAAFCAVLSDFVADCSEGFVPDSGTYEKVLEIRAPRKHERAETERERTWKMIGRLAGKDYGPMPPDFGTPEWLEKQRNARK
jgi:hypothetical protein